MKELYNECLVCRDRWQVLGSESLIKEDEIFLDEVDKGNITRNGQLYVICEDCGGDTNGYANSNSVEVSPRAVDYLYHLFIEEYRPDVPTFVSIYQGYAKGETTPADAIRKMVEALPKTHREKAWHEVNFFWAN